MIKAGNHLVHPLANQNTIKIQFILPTGAVSHLISIRYQPSPIGHNDHSPSQPLGHMSLTQY